MKKSLVALAALAVSGVAMAQSTVYGVVDVGYGVKSYSDVTGTTTAKQTGIMDGGSAGNRLGWRSNEDLGGGLSAGAVVELGFAPTTNNLTSGRTGTAGVQYNGLSSATDGNWGNNSVGAYSQTNNRQTYVRLGGGFGEIRGGFMYTAVYEISTLSGFTNTSEGVVGGHQAHLFGQGAVGGTRANGIAYYTPKWNGFQAIYTMGSGGGREQTDFSAANGADGKTLDKQQRTSLQLDYNSGPLRVGFATTSYNDASSAFAAGNTLGQFGALTSVTRVASTALSTSNTMNQLGGSYDLGSVKLGATMVRGTRNVAQADTTAGTTVNASAGTALGDYTWQANALSFAMPIGAWLLNGGMGTASFGNAANTLMDYQTRQLGLDYNFSKRTRAYGYIGSSVNNAATAAGANIGVAAKDQSQTMVGVRHDF